MKKLIVCCDGTWNTLEQEHDGVPIPTNVGRFFFSLDSTDSDGNQQKAYYHPGVGTNPGLNDKVFGGALGDGLDKNIKSAYRWICDSYDDGDELFLYGFSRGAYTARSLSGFLMCCGILDLNNIDEKDVWERIDKAYKEGYRDRTTDWLKHTWNKKIQPEFVIINFIGVWDTVGALGIPDSFAILSLLDNFFKLQFHDTELSEKIKVARHAIALDECRASFTPTLWTKIPPTCDVSQVWFPGVHSDVGGGYPETGLSDGALLWMIEESEKFGLKFQPKKKCQIKPDYQGVLHNSYTSHFKTLGSQPRSIPPIDNQEVHQSAKDRYYNPPITEKNYIPTHYLKPGESEYFSIFARDEWNHTWVYMKAGETYSFKAVGEWIDGNIKAGPNGTKDSGNHMGQLIHDSIDIFGKLEGIWQQVSNNPNANLLLTKREETYEWFALIGVIANGGNPTIGGAPDKHEVFLVGSGCEYTIKKSGYFLAFANDAWRFYDNNRGSVKLTVTRM